MKKLATLFALIIALSSMGQSKKISGVTLPGKLKLGESELILNGGEVREKYWIDLYVGGLYLESKSSNGKTIIAANKPMAIKLHIVSSLIDSETMIDAVNDGFERATEGNTKPIQAEIDQLIKIFSEPIKDNDEYILGYIPGKGVEVLKNGKSAGVIEGFAFKKALFSIWLGDEPASSDLKKGMLGAD